MATSREILKRWFETGCTPTESQFAQLIDAFYHKDEDKIELPDMPIAEIVHALDESAVQNINTSKGTNAVCNVALAGDTSFKLAGLSGHCCGCIDIKEQAEERAITILAESAEASEIAVKVIDGNAIATNGSRATSISWAFNGLWLSVNFSYYV